MIVSSPYALTGFYGGIAIYIACAKTGIAEQKINERTNGPSYVRPRRELTDRNSVFEPMSGLVVGDGFGPIKYD
jgi:hypothetical protein